MTRASGAALALAVAAALSCGQSSIAAPATSVRITLSPAVVQLGQTASIAVDAITVHSLEARLAGATRVLGKPLPWARLRLVHGRWCGTLAPPELLGIYPVELRVGPDKPVLRSERWLLRVFTRGTESRPLFDTPEEVARWWVQTVPGHATFVALKRWPRPGFDRRDPRLHQLLVVAYSDAGKPAISDRLGIFITAVREGYHGRWRLLAASVSP
jgi:hypothetical protein